MSSEEIQGYFKEIVGKPCTEGGIQLCKLMLYRTAFALQFRNVGIKPYTSLEENDVGWVRMREGATIIDSSSVEVAYEQLASAKKWYKRQYFEWDQQTQSYQRDPQEGSNPWETGLVHFRIHGFVDVEAANFCELLFTYVHETSHAWANTRDNTSKWGGGSMYLRKWVKEDRETTIKRAKEDSVLLLTSADFISYVILRKAGIIQPEFLDRPSWKD